MSVAAILVLIAPLAGAMLAPAFAEFPTQRRVLTGVCVAAFAAGAALALVRTTSGAGVAWRGFMLDPWRALLVAGAVVSSAHAVFRADDAERAPLVQAAVFAATAALIAPLFVTGAHTLAVTLPIGTVGFAVAAFATTGDGPGLLRATRGVAALAASDVLVLVALGMSLANGTGLPPELSTVSAFLLLTAAVPRLGLAPFASGLDDAIEADRGLGALWNGGVRAQGFLLALMAIGSHRSVAYAAAAAAALSLVVAGIRAWRDGAAAAPAGARVAAVGTAVAVLGFALGGPPASWGAVLALAAAFVAWPVWSAGGGWGSTARASLGAIPAGGLLAGATLVVAATLEAGTARPWFLALAVPSAAGLLAAAAGVWKSGDEPAFGELIASRAAAAVGLVVALGLAAVPARAARWLADPVTNLLGTGGLLSAGTRPGVPEELAAVALGAAAVAFAVGPGRMGSGGSPERRRGSRVRSLLDWWGAAAPAPSSGSTAARSRATLAARRWGVACALLFAVAVGLALRFYVVASGRGFL